MDLTDFKYQSNFQAVGDVKIHYLSEGQGDPIIFLHGIPTWCYLWRNIIPYLSSHAQCIAPDLVGCGYSDKPDISYSLSDHIDYFQSFMNHLGLSNITLVMHGWGSVIGTHYAMTNPDKIKGLAFLEAHLKLPSNRGQVSLPVQEVITEIKQDKIKDKILNSTYYVEKVLQSGVLRRLSAEELAHYLLPYEKPGSRNVIWQYLLDYPLGDNQTPANNIIENYSQALQHTEIPKLLMYAVPGFITPIETVRWAKEHLSNLELADVGEALHYAQESQPEAVGEALSSWYQKL